MVGHCTMILSRSVVLCSVSCLFSDVNQPADMLVELLRREKNAGIKPDEDLDVFMKVDYIKIALPSLHINYIIYLLCHIPCS